MAFLPLSWPKIILQKQLLTTNWFESILCQIPNYLMLPQGRAKNQQELAGISTYYCNDQKNSRFIFVSENISTITNFFHKIYHNWDYWDVIVSKSSSVPRYISQLHFFFAFTLVQSLTQLTRPPVNYYCYYFVTWNLDASANMVMSI